MELARMKREGFSVPSGERDKAPESPNLPTEIEAAIIALGLHPQTERELRKTAWERLRAGMSPEDIAAQIDSGEPVSL